MRGRLLFVVTFGALAAVCACGKKTPPKEPTITETISDGGTDDADAGAPVSAEKSLYERLGAKDGVAKIVDSLIKAIAGDAKLKVRFAKAKGARLEKLKQALVEQICTLTGGAEEDCNYKKDMAEAHKGMRIREEEWTAFLGALKTALEENEIPDNVQNDLRALFAPMHDDIVTAKPAGRPKK